jgi:hypothetical protein
VPATLTTNQWGLGGTWNVAEENAKLARAGGRIAFRFHARDVNLVMGPASREAPIPFRILLDGAPPGDAHGVDTDATGGGTLGDQRTYQLIRQHREVTDRTVEIEFLGAGAEAYCFTFG